MQDQDKSQLPPLPPAPPSRATALSQDIRPLTSTGRYESRAVLFSVLVCYLVVAALTSRNLNHWASRLPVSRVSAQLKVVTDKAWALAAAAQLDAPEARLETWFMQADGANPQLYPKSYADEHAPRTRSSLAKTAGRVVTLAAKAPAAKARPTATSRRGPSVLVLGDSIMMSIGPVIKHDIIDKLGGDVAVNARLSTGLSRPDVYDWVKELQRAVEERHYDDIVMMLGTNDSQDFVDNGQVLTYGSVEWAKVYNQRLATLMDKACLGTEHGIWIGLPPMRSAAFNAKAERINRWAKEQVDRHPCMSYVALDRLIGDPGGHFVSYRKIDEHLEKVRMVDGIHVTAQGGILVSQMLLPRLRGVATVAH